MNLNSILKFLFLAGTIAVSACAPQKGGSGQDVATTTEWKEGYGGDSIAIEAVQLIQQTCTTAKRLRAPLLHAALETDVEIATAICGLLDPGVLVIESVKQPKVNGIDKDAANYPDQKPKRLEIKAAYWRDTSTTPEKREEMLLHELLPLVRVDDRNYTRSSRFLVALNAARGTPAEVTCDAHRIGALLSGANLAITRMLGRELGQMRCFFAKEILKGYRPTLAENEAVKTEMAQALALGAFIGATQIHDSIASKLYEDFFMSLIDQLPVALAVWSPGLCALDAPMRVNANLCAGLLSFWFGATPEQKALFVTEEGTASDFDRASMSFLNRMVQSSNSMVAFTLNGRVDTDYVKAAIRSQNWMQLFTLGQVHRALNLPGHASEALTHGFLWRDLIKEGSQIPDSPRDRRRRVNYLDCSLADLKSHVRLTLDGAMPTLNCDQTVEI